MNERPARQQKNRLQDDVKPSLAPPLMTYIPKVSRDHHWRAINLTQLFGFSAQRVGRASCRAVMILRFSDLPDGSSRPPGKVAADSLEGTPPQTREPFS